MVTSMLLVENGNPIFSNRQAAPSKTEDHLVLQKVYDGNGTTTKSLADKVTGVEIILNSPRRRFTWKFLVTHLNIGFERR